MFTGSGRIRRYTMGAVRKVIAWLATTIAVSFVLLIVSVVFSFKIESIDGWVVRIFFGGVGLVWILIYAIVTIELIRLRCEHCKSWNVWRNFFARSTGQDFSDSIRTHYHRTTHCYHCGEESGGCYWTSPTDNFLAPFLD